MEIDSSTTPLRSPHPHPHSSFQPTPTPAITSGIPPPTSKLPRLASPAKAAFAHKPSLSVDMENNPFTSSSDQPSETNAGKRKRPIESDTETSTLPSTNKRPTSAQSTTGNPKPILGSRSISGGGASGSGAFVPVSRVGSTTTTRRALGASTSSGAINGAGSTSAGSRPTSALGKGRPGSALGGNTTTSSTLNRTRTASNSNLRGAAASTSSLNKSTVGRKIAPPGTAAGTGAGVGGSRLGRSVLGSAAAGGRTGVATGIGSGMASVAQLQSQTGRIDSVESMLRNMQAMMTEEREKVSQLHTSHADLQSLLTSSQDLEREARRNLSSAGEELAALRGKHQLEVDDLERQVGRKERERRELEDDLRGCRADLEVARGEARDVRHALNQQATQHLTMTAELAALREQNKSLQSEIHGKTVSMAEMKAEVDMAHERVREVEEDLRAAETIRRRLHNQVQELKGNIRVFARVRPAIGGELERSDGLAEIDFGIKGQLTSSGQQALTIFKSRDSAVGTARKEGAPFSFDKVFQPGDGQQEVFEEISMLAQSVLDGYNVCIFAYGQTGSGKSWTMEGGKSSATAGMIPRAIQMIFAETEALKDRGWRYQMQGQFVEIYNEKINNLFGSGSDNVEHKIEHDEKKGTTSVTGIAPILLREPDQVHSLLARASNLRSVAATNMNERSSRSHSVFSLKVKGENPLTGESCEGVLNLVDLAGSERLDKAGTGEHKDRMKETININKSLSSLQNVIQKLSEKSTNERAHVGYRDSTLTNLLMYSLSGHSKTLMFCNLSPMAAHVNETLNSLRFATKVNSTTIGTAKRQARSS